METTINDFTFFSNNYMNILLGMSDDTKLRIIRSLTDSLLNHNNVSEKPSAFTSEMLKKHAGAWVSNETADEIISTIRENSSIRKPLPLARNQA